MWPFRRRRPAPAGTMRLGDPSPEPSDYTVFIVSESRFPETYAAIWQAATDDEQDAGEARRWATLLPIFDPRLGTPEVVVQFDGMTAGYLRPPHLDRIARRARDENVETIEVPALVVRGPAGPTVTLRIDIP